MSSHFHEIESVISGSIAHEMGITPGDKLLSLNGEAVLDILDYRFRVQEDILLVEIEKADGEIWEIEVEKDPDEDLGILFVRPLMSASRVCCNQCVFCFVDQQPKGLRDSLYVKDDDARLSFLMGNYATITNLSKNDIARLAGFHLSPLRISVHAADLDLRCKMMGTERARNLFDALAVFGQAGIEMHFQAVICKGLNDGAQLEHTIEKLAGLKGAASFAVVPVGLTGHRDGLFSLSGFDKAAAAAVIRQVVPWQNHFRATRGSAFVFLSDEWYIMAEETLPAYDAYEDFPQLDNGVGVVRLFEWEWTEEAESSTNDAPSQTYQKTIGIVTGKAAADFMRRLAAQFETAHPYVKITVYAIENEFFGEDVTVSGLIVGRDIINQIKSKIENISTLFLPQNAFRANTEDMLDGCTRGELEEILGVPVKIGSADGGEFYRQMYEV